MISGGYGGGDIPVPIPNTAVKPTSADGTWGSPPGRVGRRRDFLKDPHREVGVFRIPARTQTPTRGQYGSREETCAAEPSWQPPRWRAPRSVRSSVTRPARAAEPRATSLTPIEIFSTGTFPSARVLATARPRAAVLPVLSCCEPPSPGAPIRQPRCPPRCRQYREGLGGTTLQSLSFTNGGEGCVGGTDIVDVVVELRRHPRRCPAPAEGFRDAGCVVSAHHRDGQCRLRDHGQVHELTRTACTDVTIAKSALWPIHWTALRLPSIPNNGLNGGIPEVSADASAHLCLGDREQRRSHLALDERRGDVPRDDRAADGQYQRMRLGTHDSSGDCWCSARRACWKPSLYSSDGGAQWESVLQRPFAGTGGGFFEPDWNSTAYIDYGETPNNFYRVNMQKDLAVHVGELKCDNANSPVFIAGGSGLVVCSTEHGATQSTSLAVLDDLGGSVCAFARRAVRVMLGS